MTNLDGVVAETWSAHTQAEWPDDPDAGSAGALIEGRRGGWR